ncbi:NAD-dependent epimerase/dehydratase family protein [Nocardia bovistercoris]|uniref:UDP-glucose 4-epimerase n=1 Tax=Nocardia bovistercoris TaxID=2785916 RepID=A0A931IB57_9NOCA|nr:NAD(P)-dependent oxidoreductase [Nocardia bovistercoris]MBH0776972.1 NAD(P)-dependent oxidoreductase [Nocardia bovistercoris]
MTAKTVLVTGAFGQIGRRCVRLLLERGHTVIAVDLHNDGTDAAAAELAVTSGTLIAVWIDLLDRPSVTAVVTAHRPAAIVHFAAILAPFSYRDPRTAREVNVVGTANLVEAAADLPTPPLFVFASSAAVYGSRNPYRHPDRITARTPVHPVDQYGEDKVRAEAVITESLLPHVILRLGGVISPDGAGRIDTDALLLMRAMPRDNRMHAVDARDAALAFANAVDRAESAAGKVLLIGGNETYVLLQRDLEDDMMAAAGIGRLGPRTGLPGDPDDELGWSFTGWFDTTESQALLDFQRHDWPQTVAWVAEAQGRIRPLLRALGPLLRPTIRLLLRAEQRRDGRGAFADPWTLIAGRYGPDVLAPTDF